MSQWTSLLILNLVAGAGNWYVYFTMSQSPINLIAGIINAFILIMCFVYLFRERQRSKEVITLFGRPKDPS